MASGDSSLKELSEQSGQDLPNLFAARELTERKLPEFRERLGGLSTDADVTVVLMGSWGRYELTDQSDDDFMVLVNGQERDEVSPTVDDVRPLLTRPPSPEGPFSSVVFCNDLVEKVGLKRDDVDNLTRRMLFVLESLPATNDGVYAAARERVLSCYLDESIKDRRVPRFFLNDVVRYWRQVCVDFAGKERDISEKWGLQNAKLRLSRKLLFAGGLLPVLQASDCTRAEMYEFLDEEFATPPSDRVARAFLRYGLPDVGGRTFAAYDEFLSLIADADTRGRLRTVTRETADDSAEFARVRELGKTFETGLGTLLFETDLRHLVREVGIF